MNTLQCLYRRKAASGVVFGDDETEEKWVYIINIHTSSDFFKLIATFLLLSYVWLMNYYTCSDFYISRDEYNWFDYQLINIPVFNDIVIFPRRLINTLLKFKVRPDIL